MCLDRYESTGRDRQTQCPILVDNKRVLHNGFLAYNFEARLDLASEALISVTYLASYCLLGMLNLIHAVDFSRTLLPSPAFQAAGDKLTPACLQQFRAEYH